MLLGAKHWRAFVPDVKGASAPSPLEFSTQEPSEKLLLAVVQEAARNGNLLAGGSFPAKAAAGRAATSLAGDISSPRRACCRRLTSMTAGWPTSNRLWTAPDAEGDDTEDFSTVKQIHWPRP